MSENILCSVMQEIIGPNGEEVHMTAYAFGQSFPWIGVWKNRRGSWQCGQWAEDGTPFMESAPVLDDLPCEMEVLHTIEHYPEAIIEGSLPI